MTKRLALGLAAFALAVAAAAAPVPLVAPLELPETTTPTNPPLEASAGASVSYCPWARADDRSDTLIGVASSRQSTLALSLPAAGEAGPNLDRRLGEPGGMAVALSSLQRRGDAAAVVEISEGPAAASAVVRGQGLRAGDLCPASIPKLWQLPGGSTREGEGLTLRLFNPFTEDAALNVVASSEFGVEAPPEFEGITVASRGWRDLDLAALLPLRERLFTTVVISEGLVIPALVQQAGDDLALWPGVGQSERWEFPLVSAAGLRPTLALANPGTARVRVEVDLFTSRRALPAVMSEVVRGGREIRVPLHGLSEDTFAVGLRADGPVSAVVLGRGEGVRAAAPGAPGTAQRWILPGFGAGRRTTTHTLYLLNSGSEATTVSLRPLDRDGVAGEVDKVALPAGTMRLAQLDRPGVAGLVAEALEPFSVAWSAEGRGGVAYLAAAPIHE